MKIHEALTLLFAGQKIYRTSWIGAKSYIYNETTAGIKYLKLKEDKIYLHYTTYHPATVYRAGKVVDIMRMFDRDDLANLDADDLNARDWQILPPETVYFPGKDFLENKKLMDRGDYVVV